LESRFLPSAVDVLTYHNDNASTGQYLAEPTLDPSNVTPNTFGKLLSISVDGQVYAEPLYLSNVTITTGPYLGTHNVLFVATEHDSLYAMDATTGAVLWQQSFINPGAGVTTIPSADTGAVDIDPEIGITSTPVIDSSTDIIYVEVATKEVINGANHYVQRLHALNVADGSEALGGPALIADTAFDGANYTYVSGPAINGTGDGSVNGQVAFNALRQLNRTALTLAGGMVYLAFASHGDIGPYHGWVLGYSTQNLSLAAAFNDTPNGSDGGIWQSGGRIAADPQGFLYVETGNGTFDTTLDANGFPASGDYGDSFLKLAVDPNSSPTNQNSNGWGLKVVDYFTPQNQAQLNAGDVDLGSGGPLVLPDAAGSTNHPQLLLGAGKQGAIYLLDRNHLGGFDPNADHVVQELPAGTINASFDTPAYYNGLLYYVAPGDVAKAFALTNGALSPRPVSQSQDAYGYPGSTPSISANGSTGGVVWDLDLGSGQLRAYAASDYGTELYTSDQAAGNRDQLGSVVKFTLPLVANGMVYVGTSNSVVFYGLIGNLAQQNLQFVQHFYEDLLNREPDPFGQSLFTAALNRGVLTRGQAVTIVLGSPEYHSDEVQRLYQQFLRRSAESAGLAGWSAFLDHGGTMEQLEAFILGSPEYYSVRGNGTPLGFLTALYSDLLNRGLDPIGQQGWSAELAAGISPTRVALQVLSSAEAEQNLVSGWYMEFLRRPPDTIGLEGYTLALQNGAGDELVLMAILSSDEYYGRQ
jgi:hypothetical protein